MKTGTTNRISTLLCLVSLLFASQLFADEMQRMRLINDPYPPYVIGEVGEPPSSGIAFEVVKEILHRLDIAGDYKLYPWKRVLNLVKRGKWDGIIHLSKNNEREEYMIFSDYYLEDPELIYYRADRDKAFEWDSYEDLKGYKIGLTSGYNYGNEFPQAVKDLSLNVEEASTDAMNFEKLLKKRTDFFICVKTIANDFFNKHPEYKGKFKTAKKPLLKLEWYMAFSKKSPAKALVPQINKTIAAMKEDGYIASISQ